MPPTPAKASCLPARCPKSSFSLSETAFLPLQSARILRSDTEEPDCAGGLGTHSRPQLQAACQGLPIHGQASPDRPCARAAVGSQPLLAVVIAAKLPRAHSSCTLGLPATCSTYLEPKLWQATTRADHLQVNSAAYLCRLLMAAHCIASFCAAAVLWTAGCLRCTYLVELKI